MYWKNLFSTSVGALGKVTGCTRLRPAARAAAPVLLLAILAGCVSSAPPQYYTLDMTPSGRAASSPYNLEVDRLMPAEALMRNAILIMKSPTEIEYYKRCLWASRIDEGVREKLEAEFGAGVENRKTLRLAGEILAFEQADTTGPPDAYIKLDIEFRKAGASRYDTPLLEKVYEVRVPALADSPKAVVEALSKGMEQIAAQIVEDVKKL